MILFYDEDVVSNLSQKRLLKSWIKSVVSSYGFLVGDISYIFCSDSYILDVNRKYLNHDYYTDIITFDYSSEQKISGDLFISVDTVKSNSELFKTNFIDEFHRVIIHGILHLCGLKDKCTEDEKKMREAEDHALSILESYLQFKK